MTFKYFNYKTDKTVFCVGAGPSARGFNFDALKNNRESRIIIVVNKVMDKIRYADFAITCDTSILRSYLPYISFSGVKIAAMYDDFGQPNAVQNLTRNQPFHPDILYIKRKDSSGLSYNNDCVHGLANSGFGALGLAFHLLRDSIKEKKIVLIGYDFKNHQDYWYNNSQLGDRDFPHKERQINQFIKAKTQLEQANIEVINCSPGSDLPFTISSLSWIHKL